MPEPREITLWRAVFKPGEDRRIDTRSYCLRNRILGIGWGVDAQHEVRWEEYVDLAGRKYTDRGWRKAANAICQRAQIDDLCWTRDGNGRYHIGRISSGWRHSTETHKSAGIFVFRDCEWYGPVDVDAIPGKILNCFRPSSTIQAISDATSLQYSMFLYNQLTASDFYPVKSIGPDLFSYFSAEDYEDITWLFLQTRGYYGIPTTRRLDTAHLEFVLRALDGRKAFVQVKSGRETIALSEYESNVSEDCEVFLFVPQGDIIGTPSRGMTILLRGQIEEFVRSNLKIMPDRIRNWVQMCDHLHVTG